MERISNGVRGQAQVSFYWHANRQSWTAPKLSGKTMHEDGKSYYIGINGKLYEQGPFDKMFGVVRTPVKPPFRRNAKPESKNRKRSAPDQE